MRRWLGVALRRLWRGFVTGAQPGSDARWKGPLGWAIVLGFVALWMVLVFEPQ